MRVLVLSAHPDDETLGCGGTILKHRKHGDRLFWLIATRPFEPVYDAKVIEEKSEEVKKVATVYGFEKTYELGFETAKLETIPYGNLMSSIGQVLRDVIPDRIYLVNRSDVHSDHRILFESSMSVLKPFHKEFHTLKILSYECLSSTDAAPAMAAASFVPNVFSDISEFLSQKLEIMNLYQSESQKDPLPRGPEAIRALARYRGATVGVEYAEAFMLIREFF